jgi:ankyrin repeat protein
VLSLFDAAASAECLASTPPSHASRLIRCLLWYRGQTALHLAIRENNLPVIRTLLRQFVIEKVRVRFLYIASILPALVA